METIKKYYRVDRRKIGFIKFIFEAYDGLATITTVDPESGIVNIQIPQGCEKDVQMILESLNKDILIEDVDFKQI